MLLIGDWSSLQSAAVSCTLTTSTFSVGDCNHCDVLLQMGMGESQMLDKILYEEEMRRCMFTFDQQFHFAVFFAYMRMREQEIRNIMWVSECVAQDQKSRITDGIVYLF